LTLEEHGVLTTCEMHTVEDSKFEVEALAAAFRESEKESKIILRSEVFREAMDVLILREGSV